LFQALNIVVSGPWSFKFSSFM